MAEGKAHIQALGCVVVASSLGGVIFVDLVNRGHVNIVILVVVEAGNNVMSENPVSILKGRG